MFVSFTNNDISHIPPSRAVLTRPLFTGRSTASHLLPNPPCRLSQTPGSNPSKKSMAHPKTSSRSKCATHKPTASDVACTPPMRSYVEPTFPPSSSKPVAYGAATATSNASATFSSARARASRSRLCRARCLRIGLVMM